MDKESLSYKERKELLTLGKDLYDAIKDNFTPEEINKFNSFASKGIRETVQTYDSHRISEALLSLNTALLFATAV